MKNAGLLCLLLAALPLCAGARSKHESEAKREFKLENRCPSTGAIEKHACPGWTIGYLTPLCAGGLDAKENMQWTTVETARAIRSANRKNCKSLMLRGADPLWYQGNGVSRYRQ